MNTFRAADSHSNVDAVKTVVRKGNYMHDKAKAYVDGLFETIYRDLSIAPKDRERLYLELLTAFQQGWLERQQAVERMIGL